MFTFPATHFSSAGGEPNGLLNNLVRYYTADNSGNFNDIHGGATGSINGATFTSDGKINGAYSGDGINDWIDTGSNIPNRSAGTFNIWVKDTRATDNANTTIAADSGSGFFVLRSSTGSDGKFVINYFSGNNRVVRESVAHSKNVWHMVTVRWNSSIVELFIDNVSQGTNSAGILGGNNNNIDLFTNATVTWFEGDLDEYALYNAYLDNEKISALWNNGSGTPYANFTS